ncbi:MAG: endolytic transglycosylase MltG [Cyanobacteria bacterium]|nr:endolytic transglycosylase MltG [Cyanobacteriota bacterium]MDW8201860.1 endolytic transglycosylase MltG [Cyanobacteriota bacterium SKYGB_h_bin112]
MKPGKSLFSWLLLVLLSGTIAFSGWQSWRWWSWATMPVLESSDPQAKTVQIQIPMGTSAQQIGDDLKAAGLIRSTTAWNIWTRLMRLRNPNGGFQSGTYELSPSQSMKTIAAKIWAGEVITLSFTIPEGWSLVQMADYFEAQGFFSRDEFLVAVRQIPQADYPWLPKQIPHLEGFLYPDTYEIDSQRLTPQDVIRRMLDRFEQVALPLYNQGRDQTKLSLLEWVTLASIVEKEAVVPEERALIAGVFTQRLKRNIPLGADPTVEYGLGVRQTADQPLTLSQVRTPSPYNTYLNPGLPPTPIAAPGIASLEAALYPEETDYLYFVARYDGTHIFSRTLAEHEAAQKAIHDRRDADKRSQ